MYFGSKYLKKDAGDFNLLNMLFQMVSRLYLSTVPYFQRIIFNDWSLSQVSLLLIFSSYKNYTTKNINSGLKENSRSLNQNFKAVY